MPSIAPECLVLDTIPAFLGYWAGVRNAELSVQVDAWAQRYMASWPDLRELQQAEYAHDHLDWREQAAQHIFPVLDRQIPAILAAHSILSAGSATICQMAQEHLHIDFPVYLVFYVGIGLGAGWATRFREIPAILFGLENIAACGWANAGALTGLMAHELGHLWHAHLRSKASLVPANETWWTLYEEGLAQYCENNMLHRPSWHMQVNQQDWLAWCSGNRSWLAQEYLRCASAGGSMQPFFGSWYELQGYRQTGYYLGHELVSLWRMDNTLRQIALWSGDEITTRTQTGLATFASG
ncbi:MAG: hypothetical protein ACYCZF_10590 [Anaerolineae bacterium]